MSSRAHLDFIQTEKRRATWQYKNYRNEEVQHLSRSLQTRGMSAADANLVVDKIAAYEDVFIHLLLVEELGLSLPDDEDSQSNLLDGLILFLSYIVLGLVPLAVYLGRIFGLFISSDMFAISCGLTLVVATGLSTAKCSLTSSHWFYSLVEILGAMTLYAAIAYFTAYGVSTVLTESHF